MLPKIIGCGLLLLFILFVILGICLKVKCPECGNECEGHYEATVDKIVWTCKKCGHRWF